MAIMLTMEQFAGLERGVGWLEDWYEADEEDAPDIYELAPMAWCGENVVVGEDGITTRTKVLENYMGLWGMRVWIGDAEPTEAERKATPWFEWDAEDEARVMAPEELSGYDGAVFIEERCSGYDGIRRALYMYQLAEETMVFTSCSGKMTFDPQAYGAEWRCWSRRPERYQCEPGEREEPWMPREALPDEQD